MSKSVVNLEELEEGIVLIRMEDREFKNTFTEQMCQDLVAAFAAVDANPNYKVAVLTGYDSYFSSGGTKDALIGIHEGKFKFTEKNIYGLSLNCKIPVISAMQGHGIGGGFVMGMYSDFVVLSRESIYTTNFMKYGFTPGMGATYILPQKLGLSVAQEMLMSAQNYRGEDLQQRGIPFKVLPRKQVLDYALELARCLAEKPRVSLITLKDHLVEKLREEIPAVIEKEVAMHEVTFHQEEVRQRIDAMFGN